MECGFKEISRPPYSPDLASSDYYVFEKLKSDLRGMRFTTDEIVQAAAITDEIYYFKGIKMQPKKCNKCIELKGDYIENIPSTRGQKVIVVKCCY